MGKVVHNQHRIDAAGVARPGAGVRFIRMSASDKRRLECISVAGRAVTEIRRRRGSSAPPRTPLLFRAHGVEHLAERLLIEGGEAVELAAHQ